MFACCCPRTWDKSTSGWIDGEIHLRKRSGFRLNETCWTSQELPAAQQSDALRLALLAKYGGAWASELVWLRAMWKNRTHIPPHIHLTSHRGLELLCCLALVCAATSCEGQGARFTVAQGLGSVWSSLWRLPQCTVARCDCLAGVCNARSAVSVRFSGSTVIYSFTKSLLFTTREFLFPLNFTIYLVSLW